MTNKHTDREKERKMKHYETSTNTEERNTMEKIETEEKKPKEKKRKRNQEDMEDKSVETPKNDTNFLKTHITSTKLSVRLSEKHSRLNVIKEKPVFKSRRKANPRLSQNNKIFNYFPCIGTIDRGRGGAEGESGDLANRFLSTRHEV